MLDPETRLAFSVVENPGVYALLLGSGISRAAEIPTGWDITVDLIRRIAAAEGVTGEQDWAAWYSGRYGGEPGYSAVLDALSVTAAERRSVLHHYIEPSSEDLEAGRRVPTRAHHAIARLVRDGFVRVIVTTNFDRLLETALKAVGVEPVVVKSTDDLAGASPLPHCRCFILKLHGDYLDNRILNTDEELASYPPEYDRLLDRILDEYGLIVAGWSGDWDRLSVRRSHERRTGATRRGGPRGANRERRRPSSPPPGRRRSSPSRTPTRSSAGSRTRWMSSPGRVVRPLTRSSCCWPRPSATCRPPSAVSTSPTPSRGRSRRSRGGSGATSFRSRRRSPRTS